MKCWMELFPNEHFYGIDYDISKIDASVKNHPQLQLYQCSESDPVIQTLFPGVYHLI